MNEQKKIDVLFFKPFIDGTLLTLKVQCNLEAKPGAPFYKGQGTPIQSEIAAVIGLASPSFRGSISLLFPKSVFLALIGNMIGETLTEITPELEDGAAELLNIIFGHAKRVLTEQGYKVDMAIPSILRGQNISSRQMTKSSVVVIPFATQNGAFHIEISLEG